MLCNFRFNEIPRWRFYSPIFTFSLHLLNILATLTGSESLHHNFLYIIISPNVSFMNVQIRFSMNCATHTIYFAEK